jgi:hypothetical protein
MFKQNMREGRINEIIGLIHCCNFFACEICQPLQWLLHHWYVDLAGGAPESRPLKVAVQGNWSLEIAERKDAGVVSGDRKEVSMMDKFPFETENEELTARRQQYVRFIPPSCGL